MIPPYAPSLLDWQRTVSREFNALQFNTVPTYMATNTGQLSVGPYLRSESYLKSNVVNGGIAALNVEMIQPSDYGAGQSVAIYAGAQISCANAGANGWAANFLGVAQSTALGTMSVLELDANNFSASATVKGLAISGVGSVNGSTAAEITHGKGWNIGISLANCVDSIVATGTSGGRGLVLHGPTVQVAGIAYAALSARQYANNQDTVFLQRFTDTAPTGNLIRAVDAANANNLFILDAAGNGLFGANLTISPSASSTPAANGQLTFQATSNTSLTFKYKGSDGTVRSSSLTLT